MQQDYIYGYEDGTDIAQAWNEDLCSNPMHQIIVHNRIEGNVTVGIFIIYMTCCCVIMAHNHHVLSH